MERTPKYKEAKILLEKVCPRANHQSGIYLYLREDMNGNKYAYIGKATDLCDRNISHIIGFAQRIDKSIKTRGFCSEPNPYGWALYVVYYPKEHLDFAEKYYIDLYKRKGFNLYNVESGGTKGKTIIGERKPPKTYREGVAFGKMALARELRHIIDTHLEIKVKKENKVTQKAIDKFWKLLDYENEEKG